MSDREQRLVARIPLRLRRLAEAFVVIALAAVIDGELQAAQGCGAFTDLQVAMGRETPRVSPLVALGQHCGAVDDVANAAKSRQGRLGVDQAKEPRRRLGRGQDAHRLAQQQRATFAVRVFDQRGCPVEQRRLGARMRLASGHSDQGVGDLGAVLGARVVAQHAGEALHARGVA